MLWSVAEIARWNIRMSDDAQSEQPKSIESRLARLRFQLGASALPTSRSTR